MEFGVGRLGVLTGLECGHDEVAAVLRYVCMCVCMHVYIYV